MLDSIFDRENILSIICRIRSKDAKRRSKDHLTHIISCDKRTNYHLNNPAKEQISDADIKLLNDILPRRRQWRTLPPQKRYKGNQKLNSIDHNTECLLATISYYERHRPEAPFLCHLDNFVNDIIDSIDNNEYQIKSPKPIPKLKGEKRQDKNKCRPISLFSLKDRIIISLTNRYLTKVFDKHFYEKSFAFRATQKINGHNKVLTHHDSVEEILQYKKQYKGKRFYVTECDISKFFDSVSHKIIKLAFKNFTKEVEQKDLIKVDERAIRIFRSYLNCYSFVHNILPLNKKESLNYWQKHKIPGGEFSWVRSELEQEKFYKRVCSNRIGIPQGGALSGLIANLVLNEVDQKLAEFEDNKLLYTRYCDDMVILHPSLRKCLEYANLYEQSLRDIKLIPHNLSVVDHTNKEHFWGEEIKSKAAYKWSEVVPKSGTHFCTT